jgi:rRNA maturation protein Nop10
MSALKSILALTPFATGDLTEGTVEALRLPRIYEFHSMFAPQLIPIEGNVVIGEHTVQTKLAMSKFEDGTPQVQINIKGMEPVWADMYANPIDLNKKLPEKLQLTDAQIDTACTHVFVYKVRAIKSIETPIYVKGKGMTDKAGLKELLETYAKSNKTAPTYTFKENPIVEGTVKFRYLPARFNNDGTYDEYAAQLMLDIINKTNEA